MTEKLLEMQREKEHWNSFNEKQDFENAVWASNDKKIPDCIEMIVPHIEHRMTGGCRVFDLGCGVGRLLYPIAKMYPNVLFTGIDFSEKMLDYASRLQNITYMQNDGQAIPYPANHFDAGYSMIMFQHIENSCVAAYLKEVSRVLKPGGVFRFQFVEGEQQHFLSHHATLDEVKKWCEDAGVKITGMDVGIYSVWRWVTVVKNN